MTARGWAWLVAMLLLVAAVFVGYLFVVQNSLRTTQLSLNLGFAAWQLTDPVPVVGLIGLAFSLGFAVSLLLFAPRALRLGRKVRQLEQEIALGATSRGEQRAEWR